MSWDMRVMGRLLTAVILAGVGGGLLLSSNGVRTVEALPETSPPQPRRE